MGLFVQQQITVNYGPHMTRGRTNSNLLLQDGTKVSVGDDIPLLTDRYRFYTTSNKGFAVLFTWANDKGYVQGAVHLPSFPMRYDAQVNHWNLPDGTLIEVAFPEMYPDETRAWRLDRNNAPEEIEVWIGGERNSIVPGEVLTLSGGTLRLDEIKMWMGYEIRYEPVLPWLFCCLDGCCYVFVLVLAALFSV